MWSISEWIRRTIEQKQIEAEARAFLDGSQYVALREISAEAKNKKAKPSTSEIRVNRRSSAAN
jgi:hypothetical protein